MPAAGGSARHRTSLDADQARSIAREFGVSASAIQAISDGRTWASES